MEIYLTYFLFVDCTRHDPRLVSCCGHWPRTVTGCWLLLTERSTAMFTIYKQLTIRGVIVGAFVDRFPEALTKMLQWVKEVSLVLVGDNFYSLVFCFFSPTRYDLSRFTLLSSALSNRCDKTHSNVNIRFTAFLCQTHWNKRTCKKSAK